MEIVKLTPERYGLWDAFCDKSSDAWFWHASPWLEYTKCYKPEFDSESFSFLVMEGNVACAICPMFLETRDGRKEFSFGGGGLPTPALSDTLSGKMRDKTLRFIFAHLDALATEHRVSRIEFRFPVLGGSAINRNQEEWNYLSKFGYLDTSIGTHLISLEQDIGALRRDVRHGHSADIDRASKSLTCEIFTKESITPVVFDTYREMHKQAAGRVTRPLRTFEIQYEIITSGNAFLAGAKKEDLFVGFSYVLTYKKDAYYASACNDSRFEDLPIAHFLQWKSIEYLRTMGIKRYEIGWQRFMPSLSGVWSDKEISISKFTRGFGGATVPLFRGEKYFDSAYFLDVYETRLKRNAEVIEKNNQVNTHGKTD